MDVALGRHVRDARARKLMKSTEPSPAAEWRRESLLPSCDRETARVNARLCLVDEEDWAGESGG